MAYHFPPDVERLVRDRMSTGRYSTEDDVLRDALLALSQDEQDLRAVQDAISDLNAGDEGVPLDQAFDAVRHQGHGPRSA